MSVAEVPADVAPWTDEEIDARRDQPMPDVPVLAGLSPLDIAPSVGVLTVAPTPGTRAAMLHVADGLVGVHEQPMGSNHAPPVTPWYGFDAAWCDMSVSYEAAHSGNAAAIGGKFAYCPAHARWFYNRGQWSYGAGDLQPGDVVFYNWNGNHTLEADHVGLVAEVHSDGTFTAYEGNHNDAFGRVRRDHTYVAGRGRPHYPNGSGSTPPSGGGLGTWPGRYLRYLPGHDLMHGQDVADVQHALARHGHAVKADGWYGPATAAAVTAFQRDAHLSADGIVGPQTWAAL